MHTRRVDGSNIARQIEGVVQRALRRNLGRLTIQRVVDVGGGAAGVGGGGVLAGRRIGVADDRLGDEGGVGRARGEAVQSIVGVGGRLAAEVGELGQIAGGVVGARLLQRAVGQRLAGDVGEDVEDVLRAVAVGVGEAGQVAEGVVSIGGGVGRVGAVGLDDAVQLVGRVVGVVRAGTAFRLDRKGKTRRPANVPS